MRAAQTWALAVLPHSLLGQLPSSSDSSSLGLGALVQQEHQAAQQQQRCQHNTDSMDLEGAKPRSMPPAQPPLTYKLLSTLRNTYCFTPTHLRKYLEVAALTPISHVLLLL